MLIVSAKSKGLSLAAREKAAGELVFVETDDHAVIRRLNTEAAKHARTGGRRLECYLIFSNATSLWLLQTIGLPKEVEAAADVFATTMEDLLAKTVFVRLPQLPTPFPPLDRRPIAWDSETTVHLVVVGSGAQAEALALNAALVAHYPNYCKDTRLRTRITLLDDDIFALRDLLTQRYVHLFDNSFHRTIDLYDSHPQCVLHRPAYEKEQRKDFVDIEWEFVRGNIRSDAVRQKLEEWSHSSRQQLTLALCHADTERNVSEAVGLPQAVYGNQVSVLCYTDRTELLRIAAQSGAYASVCPFGPESCNLQTLRTLKRLAQGVNYVYSHCFALAPGDPVTAPSAIDETKLDDLWESVGSLPKQYSNIFNAMTLGTKMHSIGHTSDDWNEYYALTAEEVRILAEVEHNRWCIEELLLGYRPATAEETKVIAADPARKRDFRNRKIHYDLRAFDDLRTDSTGKNVNVYDWALTQGIPLIIKSCITD